MNYSRGDLLIYRHDKEIVVITCINDVLVEVVRVKNGLKNTFLVKDIDAYFISL